MGENGEPKDGTERINLMSVVDLYVDFDDGTTVMVRQNMRMLMELYRALGWATIGDTVAPVEAYCWCAWWAMTKEGHRLTDGVDNYEQLAESIINISAEVPKELQRSGTSPVG